MMTFRRVVLKTSTFLPAWKMSSTYWSSSFQLGNILVGFRNIKERIVIFLLEGWEWGGG